MIDHKEFRAIKAFVFDVDGVFTNSDILITDQGEMLRLMNTRDGQGVKFALDNGYLVFIITKGASPGVRKRFELLGLTEIHDKVTDKKVVLLDIYNRFGLSKHEVLYMGDDIPDLLLFDEVGISSCPSDAAVDVLQRARYISPIDGGKGCVREIIERVMRIQDKWVI